MMQLKDIPEEKWKKLDEQTQATILDYINYAHPDKGPSEKVEEWIKMKLKEVA